MKNHLTHHLTLLLSLFISAVYGQADDYRVLLDSAKTLFKSTQEMNQAELDQFDYHAVASLFERVIELEPDQTEARYFLAYTYSRINSRDGRSMVEMNPELVMKCSEQLEKLIQTSPKYTGEIYLLDPYSKITSEWGSLAMSYWHNNKSDSALWAFGEGKRCGGFGSFILELNRKVLDACAKNSILISSGDNFSIPLWYLQIAEKYRTDITVVDVSLLNTSWYPAFLSRTNSVSFNLPHAVLDTLDYVLWTDTTITINNFSWVLKPTYQEKYLLRGDRIFLSLLQENRFQRDLYFTIGFMEESRLSLSDYLNPLVFADQLSVSGKSVLDFKSYKAATTRALKLSEQINLNSQDDLKMLDFFRYDIFVKTRDLINAGEKKKAGSLLKLLDRYADEERFPYKDERWKRYVDMLRRRV